MGYWLDCSCGNRVEVTAAQAGTKTPCPCGNQIEVPRLSVLRGQEGSGAPPLSPELVINRLYCEGGRIVGGGACLRCGTPTPDRLECVVECEKPWVRRDSPWAGLGVFALFGVLGALVYYLARSRTEGEVLSEGKSYRVAVSVCSVCQGHVSSAEDVRRVLRRDRDFAHLLDKYPAAEVWRGATLGG